MITEEIEAKDIEKDDVLLRRGGITEVVTQVSTSGSKVHVVVNGIRPHTFRASDRLIRVPGR